MPSDACGGQHMMQPIDPVEVERSRQPSAAAAPHRGLALAEISPAVDGRRPLYVVGGGDVQGRPPLEPR
jgi:hypothetical protein